MNQSPISWENLPKVFQRIAVRKPKKLRITDLLMLPTAIPWIVKLGKLEFLGPNTEIDRLTRTLFGRRRFVGRLLHTAYFIPESLDGFFTGSSQANLRKSSNAARRDGFTATWSSGEELLAAVNSIFAERQSKKGELNALGLYRNTRVGVDEAEGVVVSSPDGRPVSVIVGLRVGGVFLHRLAIGSEHGRPRWLAFATLITEGHSRGVRLIVGERVWAMRQGDILFQNRLGFIPVNLTFTSHPVGALEFRIVPQ